MKKYIVGEQAYTQWLPEKFRNIFFIAIAFAFCLGTTLLVAIIISQTKNLDAFGQEYYFLKCFSGGQLIYAAPLSKISHAGRNGIKGIENSPGFPEVFVQGDCVIISNIDWKYDKTTKKEEKTLQK